MTPRPNNVVNVVCPALPRLQDMPPKAARLCLRVRDALAHEFGVDLRGQTLLLAVSSGADSTAMLVILHVLQPVIGHGVRVVHIDHGLRPESATEALHIQHYCQNWNIACTLRLAPVRDRVRHNAGWEEAGRALRYAILQEEREKQSADWICTGHHSGDLAEDILLRLMRGAGWPALGGMPGIDKQRNLLRPLLFCAPEDLRVFLRDCGIAWIEDTSNADTRFTRNSVRHRVLPVLREHNPNFLEQCRAVWQRAQDDTAYWTDILDALWDEYGLLCKDDSLTLPARLLRSIKKAVRIRCYIRALREVRQPQVTFQARHDTLYCLDAAWCAGRGNTHFQFSGNVTAIVRRGDVTITAFPQD